MIRKNVSLRNEKNMCTYTIKNVYLHTEKKYAPAQLKIKKYV